MLTLLLLFPCLAIIWMLVCNALGLVEDQPLMTDDPRSADLLPGRPSHPARAH